MNQLIVETKFGKVRGKKEQGFNGIEFYSYKGIPYAAPPVGKLRFKDPQPFKSWIGVRDATSHSPYCAQKDFYTQQLNGSDDCLYLNVYTRCIDPEQRWPVMVWIFGGGFYEGHGDDSLYGPDYFMLKDVILVTFNYRVGVLGFLNLDDEVATGNQGLKDQVMALQWVRDNVANFGGDPNNVTIFGQSAGSASVHYLTLSPLAKGLFHKAIAQSGVALSPRRRDLNFKEKVYRLCEELGYKSKDPVKIVEFLRSVDAITLVEAQEKIKNEKSELKYEMSFGPGIDSKSKTPFLTVHPEETTTTINEVPLIIGYNSREGSFFLEEILEKLKEFDNDPSKLLNSHTRNVFKKLYNLTADDVVNIYFNREPVTNKNHDKLADFLGDIYFVENIQRVIKSRIDKNCGPTYVYQFTYDKDPSIYKSMLNISMTGATHGDELEFLFRGHFFDDKYDPPEKGSVKNKIMRQMIELWVNFAGTGTPTPKISELLSFNWQPVNEKTSLRYLNISENLRMEVTPYIYQQYIARKYPKLVP